MDETDRSLAEAAGYKEDRGWMGNGVFAFNIKTGEMYLNVDVLKGVRHNDG